MVRDGEPEWRTAKFVTFAGGTQRRYDSIEAAREAHPCWLNSDCGPSDVHVPKPSTHGDGSLFGEAPATTTAHAGGGAREEAG